MAGSCESFPCHKLFQAKATAITHGPNTIWFNRTCKHKKQHLQRKWISFPWNPLIDSSEYMKATIPSSTGFQMLVLVNDDQDTDTMHESQGHIGKTHRTSSEGPEANHNLTGALTWHPRRQILQIKFFTIGCNKNITFLYWMVTWQ